MQDGPMVWVSISHLFLMTTQKNFQAYKSVTLWDKHFRIKLIVSHATFYISFHWFQCWGGGMFLLPLNKIKWLWILGIWARGFQANDVAWKPFCSSACRWAQTLLSVFRYPPLVCKNVLLLLLCLSLQTMRCLGTWFLSSAEDGWAHVSLYRYPVRSLSIATRPDVTASGPVLSENLAVWTWCCILPIIANSFRTEATKQKGTSTGNGRVVQYAAPKHLIITSYPLTASNSGSLLCCLIPQCHLVVNIICS